MLQGLGGGSGTGVLFPSVVWSGARTAQSKWGEPPKMSFISGSVFVAFGPLFRRLHLLRKTLFRMRVRRALGEAEGVPRAPVGLNIGRTVHGAQSGQ